MEKKSKEDRRGKKIVFLSHCILNQNAKVQGIASHAGMITPVVELLLKRGIGVVQMACPEMTYIGAMRWSHVKDQYDSPMFRRHARGIAEAVLDQAEEYRRAGYQILGFVMVDGSPVCGLKKTHRPGSSEPWGGMVWSVPESRFADGSGVYCGILKEMAIDRGFGDVPFVSLPETVVPDSMDAAVKEIEAILA